MGFLAAEYLRTRVYTVYNNILFYSRKSPYNNIDTDPTLPSRTHVLSFSLVV